ncbi:MAG TPA: DUF2127 domain-containing protein [Bryobacteraceae bacterium]|nr:DUF2127 domain-containing protein [Bryobacteraceae bacterium]
MKRKARKPFQKRESATGLILIGLFKLAKAVALIAVGIGALRFLHRDLAASAAHWIDVLRVDPDNRFIHPILAKLFSVTPKQLKELSAGTFFYAGLLGIEGIGLLLRKHWAEYFTIISTGALMPLEIYELAKHVTIAKIIVLVVNAAIVWYLIVRVRHSR